MQYNKSFFFAIFFCLSLTSAALAQQPAKVRKPVKNPPQYPNIIDLEGTQPQQKPPAQVCFGLDARSKVRLALACTSLVMQERQENEDRNRNTEQPQ